MAWNEPNGDNDKDREDWNSRKRGKQSPPDLDEAFRNFQRKLSGLFSGKGGGSSLKLDGKGGLIGSGLIFGALFLIWGLSGIFIVGPAEEAVVLRLGKYVDTVGPGPHWIPRLIDSKYVVNIQKVSTFSYSSPMLTKDENIVNVETAVQFRVDDPRNFLFNVVNPQMSLQQASASALRQVVGHTTLDDILTTGREAVRTKVTAQLKKIMQMYRAGIAITDVTMQPAKAPEEVKSAFDDAIKAQEDEQRFINQAQAYARGVEPIAKGQAKRLEQESQAYKQQVILLARGSVSKFLALLPEYKRAPAVTRERMYLSTVESVLSHTSKILVDTNGSHNMFYLPLAKFLQSGTTSNVNVTTSPLASNTANLNSSSSHAFSTRPSRDSYNSRGDS